MPMVDTFSPGVQNGLTQQLGGLVNTLAETPQKLMEMRLRASQIQNEAAYRNLMSRAMLERANAYGENIQGLNQHRGNQDVNADTLTKLRALLGLDTVQHHGATEATSKERADAAQENADTNAARSATPRSDQDEADLKLAEQAATQDQKANTDVMGRIAPGFDFQASMQKHYQAIKAMHRPSTPMAPGTPGGGATAPQQSGPSRGAQIAPGAMGGGMPESPDDAAQRYMTGQSPDVSSDIGGGPNQVGPGDAIRSRNNVVSGLQALLQPSATGIPQRGAPADPNARVGGTVQSPTPGEGAPMPARTAAGAGPSYAGLVSASGPNVQNNGGPVLGGAMPTPANGQQMNTLPSYAAQGQGASGQVGGRALNPSEQMLRQKADNWLQQSANVPGAQARIKQAILAADSPAQDFSQLRQLHGMLVSKGMESPISGIDAAQAMPTAAPQAPSPAQQPTPTPSYSP